MGRRLIVAMLSAAVVSCALAGQATASPKTELGTSLSRLVKSGAPGTALSVRRGGATTRVARGLSEVAGRRPMRAADTFRVGSLTKTYIATLVVQLAAEHKLSLDDPVATSLPGLIPGGEAITILWPTTGRRGTSSPSPSRIRRCSRPARGTNIPTRTT
jgi:D-alanyl-D-alanine carboxypeptidase